MSRKIYWQQRNDSRLKLVLDILRDSYGRPQRCEGLDFLQVLVLTILSQNTTDLNAHRAYVNLLTVYSDRALPEAIIGPLESSDIRVVDLARRLPAPDWTRVFGTPEKELAGRLAPAGLQLSKARTVKALLAWVRKTPGFDFLTVKDYFRESSAEAAIAVLIEIKGIGVKTAGVALMETSGADICPVDTHVNRICRRLKLVEYTGSSRTKVFWELRSLIPEGRAYELHHNLLSLGRQLCKARNPRCGLCPVSNLCWDFRVNGQNEERVLRFAP